MLPDNMMARINQLIRSFEGRPPNPKSDWALLVCQLELDFRLTGNCFLWTITNSDMVIVEAYRLNPLKVAFDGENVFVKQDSETLVRVCSDAVEHGRKTVPS